jgi:hypothetical protein
VSTREKLSWQRGARRQHLRLLAGFPPGDWRLWLRIETSEAAAEDRAVSCQKGKPIRKAKLGDYRCRECGFVSSKKKKLCEPQKVKK